MNTVNDVFAGFLAKINSEFLGTFLSYANEMWLGFYGLFIIPTALFLLITGVRYMVNDLSGDKLKATYIKFGKYLFLCLFGYVLLPTIENIEQGFENLIAAKASTAKLSMIGKAEKKAAIYNAQYEEKRKEFCELYNEKMNRGETWWDTDNVEATLQLQRLATFNPDAISHLDANEVRELQAQANIVYDARQDAEAANQDADRLNKMMSIESNEMQNEEDESIFFMSFWEIITLLLSFLAGLIEVVVRMVRMFILIVLRFSFPIALGVTIIPGLEKTAESWWESYKTVLLWGVVLILVRLIISFSANMTAGFDDSAVQIVAALFQFIGGVFYLLSPNITVMCFGGSSAVSQLPQQMVQSMSAVAALTATSFKKGFSGYRKAYTGVKAANDFNQNPVSHIIAKAESEKRAQFGKDK